MSTTARSLQSDERFLLVHENIARSIACHLFREVCDLMKEREAKRLTGLLSQARDELFSEHIAEKRLLTEGVSNAYLFDTFRDSWNQIETIGYQEWKILEDRAFDERLTALRARQKAAASQLAEGTAHA